MSLNLPGKFSLIVSVQRSSASEQWEGGGMPLPPSAWRSRRQSSPSLSTGGVPAVAGRRRGGAAAAGGDEHAAEARLSDVRERWHVVPARLAGN
jgi:hypothetical protein